MLNALVLVWTCEMIILSLRLESGGNHICVAYLDLDGHKLVVEAPWTCTFAWFMTCANTICRLIWWPLTIVEDERLFIIDYMHDNMAYWNGVFAHFKFFNCLDSSSHGYRWGRDFVCAHESLLFALPLVVVPLSVT